jgi:hypothetical protein
VKYVQAFWTRVRSFITYVTEFANSIHRGRRAPS